MKKSKHFITILFLFFLPLFVFSQQNITLDQNFKLPNNAYGGNIVVDLLEINGKIFAYSTKKVIVYSATSLNELGTIDISNHMSKYNPLYFYERLYVADNCFMTYNSNYNLLYIVKPNMDILIVDISTNDFNIIGTWQAPTEDNDDHPISHLTPVHGVHIIKYDNIHQRLYWLVRGRHLGNETGNFHYRDSFIGVYKITNNGTVRNIIDTKLFENNGSNQQCFSSINDVEFTETNNYFYLARKLRVDVFNITYDNFGNEMVDLENPLTHISTDNCKYSKLLYIHESGINKIITVPYRLPMGDEPPLGQKIHFYAINVTDNSYEMVLAPHKKIIDASFVSDTFGKGYLFFCYEPKGLYNYYMQGEPNYDKIEGSDVAVYRYYSNSFDNQIPQFIKTGNNTMFPYEINLDRPLRFIPETSNSIVVSKTHSIIRLNKEVVQGDTVFVKEPELYKSVSSHFYKGVKAFGKLFVLNKTKSGIEIFDNSNHITKQTGFSVYDATANPHNGKIYFYNRMNSHNTDIFVYNTLNNTFEADIMSPSPIGDMIYNPYTHTVLFSENDDHLDQGPTNIYSIGDNNSITPVVSLTGHKYLEKMFVSPEGKLYIASDMRNDNPNFYIFNASDYSLITGPLTVNGMWSQQSYFKIFFANYVYCCGKTYALLSTNSSIIKPDSSTTNSDPYFSISNSTINLTLSFHVLDSRLIRFNSDSINILMSGITLNGARQLICKTDTLSVNDMCSGKLYINADTLVIYNIENNSKNLLNKDFNKIVYSTINNKVYGFSDEYDDKIAHRTSVIYEINETDSTYNYQPILKYDGLSSSFFYNPYDKMLYLQTKTDASRLGNDTMLLYRIDPLGSNLYDSISLLNRSFYTEVDYNDDYHYYNYNLTTPYIDPYNNKIYLPNGGHSNVSVVSFTPDEPLLLKPYDGDKGESFTWLSFPRLPSSTPTVNQVLAGDNIMPNDSLSAFYKQGSKIWNLPLDAQSDDDFIYNTYSGGVWNPDGYLSAVKSICGYKLLLKYNQNPYQNIYLLLHGTVADPSTTIPRLYGNRHENWIGYWLYETQDIFDALDANYISGTSKIYSIKHQDWSCVKDDQIQNPGGGSPGSGNGWICSSKNHFIKYGDMVILKTIDDIFNFHWNSYGSPPEWEDVTTPEHYTYDEKPDYTPVVVLLDTNDHPLEIGVFVNDTCIGANTVNDGDSVVVIRSYTAGNVSDSLTFEKYYGSKSAQQIKISDYYMRSPFNKYFEKRKISAGEKADYFVVSFRKQAKGLPEKHDGFLKLRPNPVTENLTVEYNLPVKQKVSLEVFNVEGKKVASPFSGLVPPGIHTFVWNLSDLSGKKLKKGLYIVKLKTDKETIVGKVIIQ